MRRSFVLSLTLAGLLTGAAAGSALAGHEHYLVNLAGCVSNIAKGQTAQTDGGGFHRFHDNVHTGVPGNEAMANASNPVGVFKVGQPGAPVCDPVLNIR